MEDRAVLEIQICEPCQMWLQLAWVLEEELVFLHPNYYPRVRKKTFIIIR